MKINIQSLPSDAAAEALAKHEIELYLDGLTSISAAAAEALAKHGHGLSLCGLTSISDAAAEALAKHEGYLLVGVGDEIEKIIDKYRS